MLTLLRTHLFCTVMVLLFFWGLPFQSTVCAQDNLTAEQWREDLAYMAEQMQRIHANLFHTITRKQFERAVEDLDKRLPSLARHEIIVELARIMTMVGDGHTRLWLYPNEINHFRRYPIMFYRFGNDLHVLAIDARHAAAVGGRLVRIGNVEVQEAYDRVRQVVHHDNEMQVASYAPRYMSIPEVLHALRIVDDMEQTVFVVEDRHGKRMVVNLSPVDNSMLPSLRNNSADPSIEDAEIPLVSARDRSPDQTPLYLRHQDQGFWHEYLEDTQTMYVQVNAIRNTNNERMSDFFERVFQEVDALPVARFVLDLRLNGGGNNYLNFPVIHGIIKRDKINQHGKLFTIISRHTFSAASHLVSYLELHTNSLFVGEPTGAAPNHFGDAPPIFLPNSNLRVSASSMFWQNTRPYPFEERRWTPPHILAEPTIESYQTNHDPALEVIRSYETQPRLRDRMLAAFERGALEGAIQEYQAFKAAPVNKYADIQGELDSVANDLLRQEKYEEAIEFLKLNVAAYPESPYVYESLGDAYRRSGDTALAIRNYNKIIELFPNGLPYARAMLRLRGLE